MTGVLPSRELGARASGAHGAGTIPLHAAIHTLTVWRAATILPHNCAHRSTAEESVSLPVADGGHCPPAPAMRYP